LAALEKVYSHLNPLVNYFYPTKKLIGKETLSNGKVKKIYEEQLKTPFQRVLEHPAISDEDKTKVKKIKKNLDIVILQENLEKACQELDYIVMKNHACPSLGQRNG